MMHRIFPVVLLLSSACGGGADAAPKSDDSAAPATPAAQAPASAAPAWRSNPASGVTVTPGEVTTIETGPHVILWPQDAAELAPPYSVRASLRKHTGRLHEGYGLMFGGTGLDGDEAEQRYSYFLIRGDGSYLIKRREGAQTPVVRDWTRHPEIARDANGEGRHNDLEVRVRADSVTFLVNGGEVATVPASELSVRGRAGLRVSHDVLVEVQGFAAEPGTVVP
ncbi:MAG: hypothetical protein KY467_12610 [Gemmatimonadetes bacterium]|nr:hypothetical protein [Gemmatimonadota bacterium]